MPAMAFHRASGYGQSQTKALHQTTARGVDPIKALEHPIMVFVGDAGTVIGNFQNGFGVRPRHPQFYLPARRGVFDGIVENVHDCLT